MNVGSASPSSSPFLGRLPDDIDSRLKVAQKRSVLHSVAEADAAAADAELQCARVAGCAAAVSTVLLDAAVKSGEVDLQNIYCRDYMRVAFARRLARARDRAILREQGPCYLSRPDPVQSASDKASVSSNNMKHSLLSQIFKPKPASPRAKPPVRPVCIPIPAGRLESCAAGLVGAVLATLSSSATFWPMTLLRGGV